MYCTFCDEVEFVPRATVTFPVSTNTNMYARMVACVVRPKLQTPQHFIHNYITRASDPVYDNINNLHQCCRSQLTSVKRDMAAAINICQQIHEIYEKYPFLAIFEWQLNSFNTGNITKAGLYINGFLHLSDWEIDLSELFFLILKWKLVAIRLKTTNCVRPVLSNKCLPEIFGGTWQFFKSSPANGKKPFNFAFCLIIFLYLRCVSCLWRQRIHVVGCLWSMSGRSSGPPPPHWRCSVVTRTECPVLCRQRSASCAWKPKWWSPTPTWIVQGGCSRKLELEGIKNV